MEKFERQVYAFVARIPAGKVFTYGMLAALCGSPQGWRQAAQALAHAPGGLPCHRVVRSDGVLAPAGVFDGQRAQLISEGVFFKPNGKVDMKRSLWKPFE